MLFLTLNNGIKCPAVGFGTFTFDKNHGEVKASVKEAIKVGYRHIDTAACYYNEHEVGQAVEECINEEIVKRAELFITTKLWVTDMHPHSVRKAFEDSRSKLNLEYVDLYLIHWPMAAVKEGLVSDPPKFEEDRFLPTDVHFNDTWKELEKLVDEGLVKSIGVSNFNHKQLEELLASCRIKPVMNQVEVHGYLNNAKLIDFCHARDVQITAYCPLCFPAFPSARAVMPVLLKDPLVVELAAKYGKSEAQVLIRWGVERNLAVIPKSITPARIKENFNVFDFKLLPEDVEKLKSLNRNARICNFLEDHPRFPFKEEF